MPQPYRGDRKPVNFQTPTPLRDEVDRRARLLGLTRGDYLTRELALLYGFPVPSYIPDVENDSQLRIPAPEQRMSA